jgi:hypothetical protein
MGNVITKVKIEDYFKNRENFQKELEEDERAIENLEESSSFSMMRMAKRYDDFFLDPLVGFFIPGFGDLLSSVAIVPALYISTFRLRSFTLTLAILSGMLIDLIVGAIPVVGDIIDAFYKSNKRAYRLVIGYIEDDIDVKEEINKRAISGCIILAVIIGIIWLCYELVMSAYHWLSSLF